MPFFKYTGCDGRVFPDLRLDVQPGEVVEADENPDTRFFEPVDVPVEPTPEPVAAATTEEV